MATGDSTRPARDVARWITTTRKESHRLLGDVELGLRQATDHLSASIAARSGPDDLAPIADIQLDTIQFLATVRPILEDLADQMARALSNQLRPLDVLAEQRGGVIEANVKAARTAWARSIRAHQGQVAQYVSGYVEGGGLAFALLTELSPEHAGHTGEVAEILSARVAFVPKRAEAGISAWLAEVQRGLEELLRSMDPPEPRSEPATLPADDAPPRRRPGAPPPVPAASARPVPSATRPVPSAERPSPARPVAATPAAAVRVPADPPRKPAAPAVDVQQGLAALVEKAKALGVRVRNIPDVPTEQYLARLGAQLAQVEAKRDAEKVPGEAPRVGLELLLQVADTLGVRLKEVPERPSDLYLEKLQAKLVEVAHRRGVAIPLALRGGVAEAQRAPEAPRVATPEALGQRPVPVPPPSTLDNSVTTDVAPDADSERQGRIDSLVQRATEAGLDLGRVPVDPTNDWLSATEAKLKAAIDRRNAERKAERTRRDAERQVQLDRLTSLAERLGVELLPPKFPTDEWLARAELRIASLLLTPAGGTVPGEAARDGRFNRLLIHAAEANVALGDIPTDPDTQWLDWAEEMVADATGAHTIVFESDTEEPRAAWLVFEEGTVQEHQWPITEDAEVSIGRGKGNTVQIRNDAGVSRRHCTVRMESGAVVIRDEGSTKGVVVDGQHLTEAMLVGGEQIVLGETLFVFRIR